ncbi:MAG: phospholipase D family protein [Woeseiaceae bacterium]|nr:phospholipase D family protein [Woeseiaceae bacterium]
MGMLKTIVGTRVPEKYQKFFNLPPRRESSKIADTDDTQLGRAANEWLRGRGDKCGILRLDLGLDALAIRVGLIDAAEKSIDIQSYLIKDDLSGNLISLKLIEAAQRGVRVRVLMDDALTEDIDAGLLSLNYFSNIEIRVFNPFPRRRSRVISFIANFNILNRRMHNKSFTVDNQVTIVGGRNIADEYYQTRHDSEFLDEDLLAIGPVVDDVSDGFDEYWNTRESVPIDVFESLVERRPPDEALRAGREFLEQHKDSPYLRAADDRLIRQFLAGQLPLLEAVAEVVLDHPDKARGLTRDQIGETSEYLRKLISSATEEVIIVSPYFVPQKRGVRFLGGLADNGVRVVVITNSLASTNHASVHAVYARYRKPLLRRGVEIYELRPRASGASLEEDSSLIAKLTLHSKVAVVDRRDVFVGSFNLDPRSLYINTEMGMSVRCEQLATSMRHSVLRSLNRHAYSLRLAPNGGLRWKYMTRNGEKMAAKEPHTDLWLRIKTRLMGLLPIESQM